MSYFLSLSLLLSSFDYRIGYLTITEIINIFVSLFLIIKNTQINIKIVGIAIAILTFYVLNGFIDAINRGHQVFEFIAFFYKYLNIFIVLFVFSKVKIDTATFRNISIIILIFWALWVINEAVNNPNAAIFQGIAFPRPFTAGLSADSHLFGFVVVLVAICAILTSKTVFAKLVLFSIALALILAIGARTPIALMIAALIYSLVLNTLHTLKFSKFMALIFFTAISIFSMIYLQSELSGSYRSLAFNIDGSVLGRFYKLDLIMKNASETLPYGTGYSRLSFEGRWVDGIIATLVLDYGLYAGVSFVLVLLLFSLKISVQMMRQGKFWSCVAFSYIVGAQFITEYLLTGRGSVLSIAFLFAVLSYESKKGEIGAR